MSRLATGPLVSPHPILNTLPGLYQDDDFLQRFLAAIDEIMAPVFTVLDGGFEAHLDPELTPADFLPWLGSWLGIVFEESWPEERRRQLLARAADLYRWRGTVRGLAESIELFTDEVPEILESGGVTFSLTPGGAIPGVPQGQILIRLQTNDPAIIDRVDRMVTITKPAHLHHQVQGS